MLRKVSGAAANFRASLKYAKLIPGADLASAPSNNTDMKTYNYKGKKVCLTVSTYANNGTLAVLMTNINGEHLDTITVNLNDMMQSDSMAYLDENNIPGIGKWVEKNGLGLPMYVTKKSGFCSYPLYTLFV